MGNNSRAGVTFVLAVVNFQLLVDTVILIDIPVLRQVLGFIYLTILPGAILLILFRQHCLDLIEKILFSVGLSLVFVMFIGSVVNQTGLSFDFLASLSTPTLLFAMNSMVFFFCVLSYFLNRNMQLSIKKLNFSSTWVLTSGFPILAISGATLVNLNGNSIILLLMIAIIALTVLLGSLRAQMNWAPILYMITLAVLLQTSLISKYIVGYDVHPAYHVFKITQNNGIWNSTIEGSDKLIPRLNQMLSVTILPTIYSNMLNLEGTWVFKIIFPSIFALVPVGLYKLYQKYMQKKAAFLAAFFILADMTFYQEIPGLPAQMIAELYLVLLLMVMFHEKIGPAKKIIFFTIFSVGIIVSHYGVSYLFMFLLLCGWLIPFLRKKQPQIKIAHVALYFTLAFLWYIYTSHSASFMSLVEMGENIYANFWNDLLNPQARPDPVLTGVGLGKPAVSIGHWMGRIFHYATQFFIVLGFVTLVLKRTLAYNSYKIDREYVAMSGFMLTSLLLIIVAPSFNLLNTTRLYHSSILFLAPFCIMGSNWFFSILPKLRKPFAASILTIIVVVSLFLFETGFVYEVTKDVSYSRPLSMYRMDRTIVYGYGYFVEGMDVASAEWLHSNVVLTEKTLIYADIVSVMIPLTSYGVFPRLQTEILTNATTFDHPNAYAYLRNFNTFDGEIFGIGYRSGRIWNTNDLSSNLTTLNKIYTNGGSEILLTLKSNSQN